jgi:hypothetical protein
MKVSRGRRQPCRRPAKKARLRMTCRELMFTIFVPFNTLGGQNDLLHGRHARHQVTNFQIENIPEGPDPVFQFLILICSL